jgi:outer membrane protein assembly factor BamD (BamD/ComL family)
MKRTLLASAILLSASLFMGSCKEKTEDDAARPLLESIEKAVTDGNYRSALDSISALRYRFPKAIESRKRALELWQQASLLQAQHNVEVTDSALQATIAAIDKAPTLLEQNMLRNKRDSLKARYDAECGVVRIIRAKQNGK